MADEEEYKRVAAALGKRRRERRLRLLCASAARVRMAPCTVGGDPSHLYHGRMRGAHQEAEKVRARAESRRWGTVTVAVPRSICTRS